MPIAALIVVTAGLATWFAPTVWLALATDGSVALLVLVAAAGWGSWPAKWLGGEAAGTALRQVCLATGLGLGITGTAALVLGMVGVLSGVVAWGLVGVGVVLGIGRLSRAGRSDGAAAAAAHWSPAAIALASALIATLSLAAATSLVAASLPPGSVWIGEGRGYDVLEYHLQAPREYYEAGRMHFLPHNVYAAFPQQVEVHYLLLMHLMGDPHAAAVPSQYLHLWLGVMAVVTLVAFAAPGWPRVAVAVVAGGVPWVGYVAGLAYVELGVMLFAGLAVGMLLETCGGRSGVPWRELVAAGLCAGLAGGSKYTALVFVCVGLAVTYLIVMRGSWRRRVAHVAIFGLAATLAVSPWLVRNAIQAGNPVYPFAYGLFGGQAWSAEQAAQWAQAHRPPHDAGTVTGRVTLAARELLSWPGAQRDTPVYGIFAFALAVAGLVLGRGRREALSAIWLVLMIATWAATTQIAGRLVMPIVVPLALLAGSAAQAANQRSLRALRWPVLLVVALVAVPGGGWLWRRLATEEDLARRSWLQAQAPDGTPVSLTFADLAVWPEFFRENAVENRLTPADARLWIVANAAVFHIDRPMRYTVVFNRDPLIEAAVAGATGEECLSLLRREGATHLVLSLAEARRLRSYGMPDAVTGDWAAALVRAGLRPLFVQEGRPAEGERQPALVYGLYEIPTAVATQPSAEEPSTR